MELKLIEKTTKAHAKFTVDREVYEIGDYVVEKVTRIEDDGNSTYFTVFKGDDSTAKYLPRIYISEGIDINGDVTPLTVEVQTTSFGTLPIDQYEEFIEQVNEAYTVANILSAVFCRKE